MNSTSGTAPIACGGVRVRGRVGARVGVVVQGGVGRPGQRASRLACSSASPHAAAPAASANSVTSAPLAAVALTCSRWKPACDHATGQGYHAALEAAGGPPRRGGWGWAAWGVGGVGRGRGRHIAELTHEARVATQEVVDVRRAEVARQPHASGRVDLAEPRQPFVGCEAR
eukprot:scaffold56777_cov64-Phaeocystis_antarctica.AAC.5